MGSLYVRRKVPFTQTGHDEQRAQKLAAAVNIDGDLLFAETVAAQDKRKMPLLRIVKDPTTQFFQGAK